MRTRGRVTWCVGGRDVQQMHHLPQAAARVEEMIAAEGNAKQAIICRFATRPVEPQPIAAPDP